jgi:hypothetical protein
MLLKLHRRKRCPFHDGLNRETGEKPVRSRHCMGESRQNPLGLMVWEGCSRR